MTILAVLGTYLTAGLFLSQLVWREIHLHVWIACQASHPTQLYSSKYCFLSGAYATSEDLMVQIVI